MALKPSAQMSLDHGLIGSAKRNDRRVTIIINGLNSKKKGDLKAKDL